MDKGLEIESEVGITADGAREGALLELTASAKHFSELAASDQENAMYLYGFSSARTIAASLQKTRGHAEEALSMYRNAESVLMTLTQLKPNDATYASELKSVRDAISVLTKVK